jgi:hypothetical protein
MENSQIEKLSAIMHKINSINDKQANLVMTRDNRIVTEQNLIAENDMLYINGFPATEMQPIAKHKTKLHNRLIELHIEIKDLTAEAINLALKEYICNFYFQQGVPFDYINSIYNAYNEDGFMYFTRLLESKLKEICSASKQVLAYKPSYRPRKVISKEASIIEANELLTSQATGEQYISSLPHNNYDTKLTANTSIRPHDKTEIFLSIQNKKGSYKINYNFDRLSAMYLKEHANKKYLSVDDWQQKLANFFLKAIGCIEKDIIVPEISLSAYKRQQMAYSTRQEAEKALTFIQKALVQQGLDRFSNAHMLNINNIKDRSTKNYSIFKSYRKALKQPKENDRELINATRSLLKHKKILSLADGYDEKLGKTSTFLAGNLESITTAISITAADKCNLPRKKTYNYKNNENITIENILLNNQRDFQYQKLHDKFDLVVSHKVLCHCESKFFDSLSCGGVPMYEAEGLKFFLLRIASVLDTTNKYAKAILTGINVREYEFWKQDIQEFNEENIHGLTAEIARNSAGVFKGIVMQVSN